MRSAGIFVRITGFSLYKGVFRDPRRLSARFCFWLWSFGSFRLWLPFGCFRNRCLAARCYLLKTWFQYESLVGFTEKHSLTWTHSFTSSKRAVRHNPVSCHLPFYFYSSFVEGSGSTRICWGRCFVVGIWRSFRRVLGKSHGNISKAIYFTTNSKTTSSSNQTPTSHSTPYSSS